MLNVLHYVSRMDRAGQETFLMNLFRKIDREKIQFDFLCSEQAEGAYDPEIRALGGHVYHTEAVTARGPIKQFRKYAALKAAPAGASLRRVPYPYPPRHGCLPGCPGGEEQRRGHGGGPLP